MTIACEAGEDYIGIVEVLLEFTASPARADACGNTPLMGACEASAPLVAELLLNAGACPRRVNAAGPARAPLSASPWTATTGSPLSGNLSGTRRPPSASRRAPGPAGALAGRTAM